MSGWRKLEKDIVDTEIFHHPEDIRLYVWILSKATHKAGVQVGGVVLGERQYIRSIGKLQEDLWFFNGKKKDEYTTSRIQRSIKRLEKCGWLKAEKFKHGFIFTVRPVKDPECGEYLKWMGIPWQVNGDSAGDQPDEGAGTVLSTGCESDMKEERMSCENRLEIVEKEEKKENSNKGLADEGRLQTLIGYFVGRRGRGFLLTPIEQMAMERISLNRMSTDELIGFMDEQFDKQERIAPGLRSIARSTWRRPLNRTGRSRMRWGNWTTCWMSWRRA
ncbi:MAG: hypothetical protein ACQEWI_08385 [Bacillota bacterium]